MRGIRGICGLALVGAALAGWVNPSGAQPAPRDHVPLGEQVPLVVDPSPLGPITPPPSVLPTAGTSGLPQAPVMPSPGGFSGTIPPGQPADLQDLGPGATGDNPTGRQEPCVSVEWIGPPRATVGHPADYTVAVRNSSNAPVQRVEVHVRIAPGMTVRDTEPKAMADGSELVWQVGTLQPKQEKNLNMKLIAEGKGMTGCQASVTFTGTSALKIRVCEPKLVLKMASPEKVMIGDPSTFVLTVTNPGDGPAEKVKIHTALTEGLESPRGKNVDFELGDLGAGESRSVQLVCGTKGGGPQVCDGIAEAEGDLKAQDKATVNVITPVIKVEVAGPKLRYLERKAAYTFRVTNPGDAPATNVSVSDVIPAGFKFLNASDGGRHDFSTRTVSWFLGELGPAQSREVKLEVLAVNPGQHHHKVAALAARGLKDEIDYMTEVQGLSALLLEVVDTEDPIEVGADTSYEIRVSNTGTKTENDIKIVCTIPDKMQFKAAQGPTRYQEQGKEVIFEPLAKLAPRADAIFRVSVKALAAGDVRFKTSLTSSTLIEPVMETESTKIYNDDGPGGQ